MQGSVCGRVGTNGVSLESTCSGTIVYGEYCRDNGARDGVPAELSEELADRIIEFLKKRLHASRQESSDKIYLLEGVTSEFSSKGKPSNDYVISIKRKDAGEVMKVVRSMDPRHDDDGFSDFLSLSKKEKTVEDVRMQAWSDLIEEAFNSIVYPINLDRELRNAAEAAIVDFRGASAAVLRDRAEKMGTKTNPREGSKQRTARLARKEGYLQAARDILTFGLEKGYGVSMNCEMKEDK